MLPSFYYLHRTNVGGEDRVVVFFTQEWDKRGQSPPNNLVELAEAYARAKDPALAGVSLQHHSNAPTAVIFVVPRAEGEGVMATKSA